MRRSPSEEKRKVLEMNARKKVRLSSKVSSSKISSGSPSRSPERKESLSPQRSIKATLTEARESSPTISPSKLKKVSSFKREEDFLPSEFGPILRKQDHLPNILFSRYATRKPIYNVEGNPHPARFENRNLFPQVMASNRRYLLPLNS